MTPLPALSEMSRVSRPDSIPQALPRQGTCVVPGCTRTARHRHHIIKRDHADDWILIDGKILVFNLADVCIDHHNEVESQPWGAIARIRWLEKECAWGWYIRGERVPEGHAAIWWYDERKETIWAFKGFLKGDEWIKGLHVIDCPMTNTDPETRTSCVCTAWPDFPRNTIEGGGGVSI